MALPDRIEIVPLEQTPAVAVTVPGSKSITNRALVLTTLAQGVTTLRGALWSEDTQVMVASLQKLGFAVDVGPDPDEPCNRHITVSGLGGRIPGGGSPAEPLELFVGNAGTAARFLTALVCLGQGTYRLHGVPRMHERPQAALFQALRELGYRVDSPNDRLPAVVHGTGAQPGKCRVSIEESSQFASALLLCARVGGWEIEVVGENAEEAPYVAMTSKLLECFAKADGVFQVEPDCSSGSYFWAAGHGRGGGVQVRNWPQSAWQIDAKFPKYLERVLGSAPSCTSGTEPLVISRRRDLGDSIMTLIVLAPLAAQPLQFTDLGRMRVQECERVQALRVELSKLGAQITEQGDTLKVCPSRLHGAEIETYEDHRVAMCFAILGLKVPGIIIKNPACVKKTFPNFFQKLAAPPPGGLGARILEAQTRRALAVKELFAE